MLPVLYWAVLSSTVERTQNMLRLPQSSHGWSRRTLLMAHGQAPSSSGGYVTCCVSEPEDNHGHLSLFTAVQCLYDSKCLAGYKVITTTSPRNFDIVKALGADAVYNYKDSDAVDERRRHQMDGQHRAICDCHIKHEGDAGTLCASHGS